MDEIRILNSAFYNKDIDKIKKLYSDNDITVNDISNLITSMRHYHLEFTMQLCIFSLDIQLDISIIQVLFESIVLLEAFQGQNNLKSLRESMIYSLLEYGVDLPTDPETISHLPIKIFIDYISTNSSILNEELEIFCCSRKTPNKLKYIHNILESQNRPITNPLSLILKYFHMEECIFDYCISKVPQDKNTFNKLVILSTINGYSEFLEHIIPGNYIADKSATLIAIIHCGDIYYLEELLSKWLDPDVMKYANVNFSSYFCVANTTNSILVEEFENFIDDSKNLSMEDFMAESTIFMKKAYLCNIIKCENKTANEFYKCIKNNSADMIANDNTYADHMEKASILLDIIMNDERLKLL
jgi:hypothetical protein